MILRAKLRPNFTALLLVHLLLLCVAWPSEAQVGTGTILGTVKDSSGGAIVSAMVKVRNLPPVCHVLSQQRQMAPTDSRFRWVPTTWKSFENFIQTGIGTGIVNPAAGVVSTTATNAREIQFGIRLEF